MEKRKLYDRLRRNVRCEFPAETNAGRHESE